MNDDIYSVQVAIEQLQAKVENIEKQIRELSTVIESGEYKSKRVFMDLEKKQATLEQLENVGAKIGNLQPTRKDKKINRIKEKEEPLVEGLRTIQNQNGGEITNKRAARESKRIETALNRLRKKRGKIEARQRKLTNFKIRAAIRWQEHLGRVYGRTMGYEAMAEQYSQEHIDKSMEADRLYANKKYIQGTSKKVGSFVALSLSKVNEICGRLADVNSVALQGVVQLSENARAAIIQRARSIHEIVRNNNQSQPVTRNR